MSTILPCPFCGDSDPAIDEVEINVIAIVCNDCGCTGPIERFTEGTAQTAEQAIAAWNRRPTIQPKQETWQERAAKGEISVGGLLGKAS